MGEEYDENHRSSDDSDEEMGDADADSDAAEEEMVERPKKKQKTAK